MTDLIERIAEEAEREPDRVVPVLQALLGVPVTVTQPLRSVAAVVDAQRGRTALAAFTKGALTTAQARDRLNVSSVQAVHRLRDRGRLLGRTLGNQTYWPAWQFTDAGLRDDLPALLDALTAFTADPVAPASRSANSPGTRNAGPAPRLLGGGPRRHDRSR